MKPFERDLMKYRAQLDAGFRNLRFDDELEQEFEQQYYDRNIAKQRTAIVVAIVLVLILFPIDYAFLGATSREYYLLVRAWFTLPVLVICFFGTFIRWLRPFFQISAFFVVLLIGVGTNLIVAFTARQGEPLPYEGLMLIIFIGFLLAGMRFRFSLACSTLLLLSYVVLAEHYMPPLPYPFHNYFFIFGSLVVGGASAYTLEYQARLGFLQRGALRNQAKIDPLTGLLNRGAINQQLSTLFDFGFREQRHLTLLLLDIDYFKKYNDLYGHIAGDECLIQFASALTRCCRRSLDFAGRYGGEEFMLVWFDTKPEETAQLSQLVQDEIARLDIANEGSEISDALTTSGGMITGIPSGQHNPALFIQKADDCLYEAKRAGRDQIVRHLLDTRLPSNSAAPTQQQEARTQRWTASHEQS